MDAPLLVRREAAVLVLSNNDPATRNALSPEFYAALAQALADAAADASVGAIVLTGEGGHFCSGGNLNQLARRRELPVGAPPDLEPAAVHAGAWVEEGDEPSGQAGRELAHCLRPMLSRLPDHYREAVTLIDLDGLSQQDAAAQAGLSLSGMKSRVQRGRRALEQVMHDCCCIETDAGGRVMDYQMRGVDCGSCGDGCGPR